MNSLPCLKIDLKWGQFPPPPQNKHVKICIYNIQLTVFHKFNNCTKIIADVRIQHLLQL